MMSFRLKTLIAGYFKLLDSELVKISGNLKVTQIPNKENPVVCNSKGLSAYIFLCLIPVLWVKIKKEKLKKNFFLRVLS